MGQGIETDRMMKKGVLVHIITIYLLLLGGYEALLGFRQLYGFSVVFRHKIKIYYYVI